MKFLNEGCLRVSISFEFLDAMKGFPVSGSEIIIFSDSRFVDTRRRFEMIIE